MPDTNINKEVLFHDQPIPVSIEGMKKIFFQLENCICQIYKKNDGKGICFFCKISFQNKLLQVLITNNHILEEKDIQNNEKK